MGKTKDTIIVTGLTAGDKITAYTLRSGGKALASQVVSKGKDSVTLTVAQLGKSEGEIYIAVARRGQPESDRIPIHYPSEQ